MNAQQLESIKRHANSAFLDMREAQNLINAHGKERNDMDTGLYDAVVWIANAKTSIQCIEDVLTSITEDNKL